MYIIVNASYEGIFVEFERKPTQVGCPTSKLLTSTLHLL